MRDDFPCVKSLSSRVGGALNHFRVAWLYHQAFQNLRSGGEIGIQLYPSQTNDVEGRTKDEVRFFFAKRFSRVRSPNRVLAP